MLSSFIQSFRFPREINALYKMYSKYKTYKPDKRPLELLATEQSDLKFCYSSLGKVSRSFSVVIQQLPEDLRDAVCVFYLVLRGLDTVEDDTSIKTAVRVKILQEFHQYLEIPGWNAEGIGRSQGDYEILLKNFQKVIAVYSSLDPKYQQVIKHICQEMGEGMVKFLDRELNTRQEYDEYCYYVAGLVGVGLTELFVSSGLEPRLSEAGRLPISMGLFLQKTNIIRDFREDLDEKRTFWPREIWLSYATSLDDLTDRQSAEAVFCLNHMIGDCLQHAADCLRYLRLIDDPMIFNFCAIPQVMAIATLEELYNNPTVFQKNVKIRKGMAADLIFKSKNFEVVDEIFKSIAHKIYGKVPLSDPSVSLVISNLEKIISIKATRNAVAVKQEEFQKPAEAIQQITQTETTA